MSCGYGTLFFGSFQLPHPELRECHHHSDRKYAAEQRRCKQPVPDTNGHNRLSLLKDSRPGRLGW
jgi:hypothetical protein